MAFDAEPIRQLAERSRFSGVVRVDRAGNDAYVEAFGLADRRHAIANTVSTRFGIASGTKGFTAVTVVSLIDDGVLDLSTTARSVLGDDLPLIDDAVTIEHLLAHRSGIGDYLDEDTLSGPNDHTLTVPAYQLDATERYLAVLDGFPTVFAPGERYAYNNGGYVVLALIAERASGVPFAELVAERVCLPAGMRETSFHRSDELPSDTAVGYLDVDGPRTNVFHLPVVGSGDGGISTTAADMVLFWEAFFAGRIVSDASVAEMVRPRSDVPDQSRRYGLGFHLHATTDVVWLAGSDVGVSFASTHDAASGTTASVLSNVSDGAWEMVAMLDDLLGL
jgi:CubicO group peptidase (beta-lactamase class C family)